MKAKSLFQCLSLGILGVTLFSGVSFGDEPEKAGHHHENSENVVNPHGGEGQSVEETLKGQPPEPKGLFPNKDWPHPVMDRMRHFMFLADLLEIQPNGDDSELRWDLESHYGGDFNRIWFKSEGEKSVTSDDYHFDAQLLYGRFVGKYYDFQIGVRGEATDFSGKNKFRTHAVVGLEGLLPYRFQIEPLFFVSDDGDVSARITGTRDMLLTQRLILQARLETTIAVQSVEEFGIGEGLNNIEAGLRLRYEMRREFAPYIGVSFSRSLFETEDFLRAKGKDETELRFVAGIRFWY